MEFPWRRRGINHPCVFAIITVQLVVEDGDVEEDGRGLAGEEGLGKRKSVDAEMLQEVTGKIQTA